MIRVSFGHGKFELPFGHLSGVVKKASGYYGLEFTGRKWLRSWGEEEEPTKEMRKQPVRQEENQKGVVPKSPVKKWLQ